MPKSLKRLLSVTFVLTMIGTLIIVILGVSLLRIREESKHLQEFLNSSRNIQANFEQSLLMYIENTQHVIKYLKKLRPQNEEDYIQFITDLEKLAHRQNITINLQNITTLEQAKESRTLAYRLSFLGTRETLQGFMAAMEALPYYVKVQKLSFVEPGASAEQSLKNGNIIMTLQLYIK